MGTIARAVHDHGGEITGIIPEFLRAQERLFRDADEVIVTADMHERKWLMFEHADAFVALPGGIGTVEELVEQLTWAQLGRHKKPILLANVAGYWDPLITVFEHLRDHRLPAERAPASPISSPTRSRRSCRPSMRPSRSSTSASSKARPSACSGCRPSPSPQRAPSPACGGGLGRGNADSPQRIRHPLTTKISRRSPFPCLPASGREKSCRSRLTYT